MTAHNPIRLLILDDERVIVDTLCVVLNQHGYETCGAYTHGAALAIAREFRPDIFLTGFNNGPDKNGCETAIELLAILPQCRVLIFSGAAATADAVNGYRKRGYEFELRAKPLYPEDLLDMLRPHDKAKAKG